MKCIPYLQGLKILCSMSIINTVVLFGFHKLFKLSSCRVLSLQVNAKKTVIEHFHVVVGNDVFKQDSLRAKKSAMLYIFERNIISDPQNICCKWHSNIHITKQQ